MGSQYSSLKTARNRGFTRDQMRTQIRGEIDRDGNNFNWRVWAVAASGFFTDSYNLFATNVILPSLAYVYWPDDCSGQRESTINVLTLVGSVIGQLVFGFLADKYGRTRLYGIELVIVIVSTLVIVASGSGIGGQMSMFAWFASFRFIMGIGVGAEYPLSAVITTEWAPTKSRGRMMAAVFLMQPLGQFAAQLVGLIVLIAYNRGNNNLLVSECFSDGTHYNGTCLIPNDLNTTIGLTCKAKVDTIWRWVAGLGAIPAALAVLSRLTLPDPGLYDLDVHNEGERGLFNTKKVFRKERTQHRQNGIRLSNLDFSGSRAQPTGHTPEAANDSVLEPPLPQQFTMDGIYEFFIEQGNWRYVLGAATCWFVVDFVFYGIGIGNPRTLAQLFDKVTHNGSDPVQQMPTWYTDPTKRQWNNSLPHSYSDLSQPTVSIYNILHENSRQNMLTVSIGSLAGSAMFILSVNYIPRKLCLIFSFLVLGSLFMIAGGVDFASNGQYATITLLGLCFFFFNFGANTLIFMIPAEIFPTRYRCTCHGIAAAAGKIGSVISTAMLPHLRIVNDWNANHLGYIFIIFGIVMLLGAPFAWAWLPEVQNFRDDQGGWKAQSKTLEDLGRGAEGAEKDGQMIGFRRKFDEVLAPVRIRFDIRPPVRQRRGARQGAH